MSLRRSRPSATKASARFDLLSRVILAAFTAGRLVLDLRLDPSFLVRAPGFALAEQTNPRSQEPAGNQSPRAHINDFPRNHTHRPIGHRAQHDGVAADEREIMERGHEKKPAKPKQVRANEFLMGLERGTQLLVM